MKILDLAYNQHMGLSLARHGDREVVCLEPAPHHRNHLGTVHAGALYSLAEAASGNELLQRIDLSPEQATAVLRSAQVKYRRPANQRLLALASIDADAISSLQQQIALKGRALLEVQVRIIDDDKEVFTGKFTWLVSRLT